MILLSLCNLPIWLLWLLWLLPLLFALWLWWYFDRKHKRKVAEYEDKIKGLNATINGIEEDLASCRRKRSELESDLALTKGRMREMEAEMRSSKSQGKDSDNDSHSLGFIAGAGDKEAETDSKDAGSKDTGSTNLDALTSSLGATEKSSADSDDSASGAGFAAAGAKSIYAGIKPDNLQIIEGIGPKMESILKENGVSSHSDLGDMKLSEIQAILDKYGDRYKIIDPKMWAAQAQLAGAGKFDELIDYQKKQGGNNNSNTGQTDSKLEKFLIKTGALKAFKQDDLKAIEGIGPATDKLLKENGINSWRDLANTSVERLQEILTGAGSRFGLSDPGTWPKQAELAADGKFDELREYQDFLDGGKA